MAKKPKYRLRLARKPTAADRRAIKQIAKKLRDQHLRSWAAKHRPQLVGQPLGRIREAWWQWSNPTPNYNLIVQAS